jgi:hypothetical protein
MYEYFVSAGHFRLTWAALASSAAIGLWLTTKEESAKHTTLWEEEPSFNKWKKYCAVGGLALLSILAMTKRKRHSHSHRHHRNHHHHHHHPVVLKGVTRR